MSEENASAAARPESAELNSAAAGTMEADNIAMHESAGGLIIAAEDVTMNQCGAGAVICDGDAQLFQSGAGVVLTNEASVTEGFVGVLAARDVKLGPETKVLTTWVEAAVFGVVFGVVAAVVDLAFRGFCRRR